MTFPHCATNPFKMRPSNFFKGALPPDPRPSPHKYLAKSLYNTTTRTHFHTSHIIHIQAINKNTSSLVTPHLSWKQGHYTKFLLTNKNLQSLFHITLKFRSHKIYNKIHIQIHLIKYICNTSTFMRIHFIACLDNRHSQTQHAPAYWHYAPLLLIHQFHENTPNCKLTSFTYNFAIFPPLYTTSI